MRKRIPAVPDSNFTFKYGTEQEFLKAYDYCFLDCEPAELTKLFFTANWMALLFTTVDARGNKGLAMGVIPRVIEGFQVRYSTGGGQSVQTASRVHIYEKEGNVKPHVRPTRKAASSNDVNASAPSKVSVSHFLNSAVAARKVAAADYDSLIAGIALSSLKRTASLPAVKRSSQIDSDYSSVEDYEQAPLRRISISSLEEGRRPVKRTYLGPGDFYSGHNYLPHVTL